MAQTPVRTGRSVTKEILADYDIETPGKARVQSAARVIDILQLVARDTGSGIPASEIAETLKLSRQVVYHLLHTLAASGMVRKSGGARYVLGLGVAPIADGFKRQLSNPDLFGNLVRDAARMTGETAYLVGWIDGNIVVRATARGEIGIHAGEIPLGTAGNAHARASGKLLLAMRPDTDVSQYVMRHPLKRRTAKTITTSKQFALELAKIRADWYSTEIEEYEVGLSCMAVPVGQVPSLHALGISAPTARFLQNQQAYRKQLQVIAGRTKR
jgi:DNA-binding IclR family transcriptional regulator